MLERRHEATEKLDLKLDTKRTRGSKVVVDAGDLAALLGPAPYTDDDTPAVRVTQPGIAVGLSAGAAGGHVMFVEATLMTGGRGAVKLTGSLGDVIKESAHIALGWVRR